MIEVYFKIDIDSTEEFYRNLLITEVIEIRKKQKVIINNARMLYNKIIKHKLDNLKLASICYNFGLLEHKLNEYLKIKEVAATIDK